MNDNLVIGLDFGTDSVRAVLLNQTGELIASAVDNYKRWQAGQYSDAAISQFCQHPLDYLESMEYVLKNVLTSCDPAHVRGIGVDTTGSTPCVVDRSGTPLALLPEFENDPDAMFLLWKNHTSIAEAEEITNHAQNYNGVDYTRYSGGSYSCEWFWAKLLYILRHNKKVREVAFSFVEHCDWITGELSGNTDPLLMKRSRCAAGHKAMWHESWGGLPPDKFWSGIDPLLAGWRSRLYDETFTADVPVGTISRKWAQRLGLPESVVISGGLLDCHAGAVGAGVRPGVLVKVVGTSTCDIMVSGRVDRCVRGICGQVDGSVLPGMTGLEAGQAAFGDVYGWFRRFLSYGGNEVVLSELEKEAAAQPIDNSVTALDWLNGRRTPDSNQYLTGAIFGLNLGTTAPMVYRALAEATVFGSKRITERFREEDIAVNEIIAVGGIAKKSPFIMQMMADVLNMPISVSKSDQSCAIGSAMFAAAGGVYKDIFSAIKNMNPGVDNVYTPNSELVEVYRRKYQHYLDWAELVENNVMRKR